MYNHISKLSAFLISIFIGMGLPILVQGALKPPAPGSGDGPNLGATVQQVIQAAGEIKDGRNKSVVLLDLARLQLLTGAREAATETTRQAIQGSLLGTGKIVR